MADTDSKGPEIKSLTPRGINLRADKNATPNGFCDREHGMWPKRTGSRARLPGKTLLRQVGDEVTQMHQAFRGPGIIFQIGDTVQYFTPDDLNNRDATPDLEQIIPSNDDFGRAYIVQMETNTTNGGSIDGFLSGSSAAVVDTFYGRRLTNMLVNETVNTLQTVSSFTASTGGSGSSSTPGRFALEVGEYDINIALTIHASNFPGENVVVGLYDFTNSAFAVHSGTTVPMIATAWRYSTGNCNYPVRLKGHLSVTGSTTTFQIMQKAPVQLTMRIVDFGGSATTMTGTNVNGAAASNMYVLIEIIRYS